MSYLWHFQSFSQNNLDNYIGTDDESKQEAFVESVTWDDWDDDMDAVTSLARKIASDGLNYEALSEEQLELADEIMKMIFSPEGLEEELDIEPESPDGLHPSFILAMLERAEGKVQLRMLPLLKIGRRIGQSTESACEYILMGADEIKELIHEVQLIFELDEPWENCDTREIIQEFLVDVFTEVQKKNKSLFGTLG